MISSTFNTFIVLQNDEKVAALFSELLDVVIMPAVDVKSGEEILSSSIIKSLTNHQDDNYCRGGRDGCSLVTVIQREAKLKSLPKAYILRLLAENDSEVSHHPTAVLALLSIAFAAGSQISVSSFDLCPTVWPLYLQLTSRADKRIPDALHSADD